jgi:hypothetical protein
MNAPITLASSLALRVRHLAQQIHKLGEAPLFYLLSELVAGSDPLPTLESYARLPADFIYALGGHHLPTLIHRIK